MAPFVCCLSSQAVRAAEGQYALVYLSNVLHISPFACTKVRALAMSIPYTPSQSVQSPVHSSCHML